MLGSVACSSLAKVTFVEPSFLSSAHCLAVYNVTFLPASRVCVAEGAAPCFLNSREDMYRLCLLCASVCSMLASYWKTAVLAERQSQVLNSIL